MTLAGMEARAVVTSAPMTSERDDREDGQRLEAGVNDLRVLKLTGRHGSADVYLHGAHITRWDPAGGRPVLWVSRSSAFAAGQPIRGGVPICFPWFGAHPSDPKQPGHGFARIREWRLVPPPEALARGDEDAVAAELELHSTEPPHSAWPHAFSARYRVVVGTTLTMQLDVANTGEAPFSFEEALHTYFAVSDVRRTTISGLEGRPYLDKVAAFAERVQPQEPIRVTAETDRVYLDTQATCTIHDPGWKRRISIAKQGSNSTVVWNPWIDKARAMPDFGDDEWPEMVCVETCNVGANRVTLAPGERHQIRADIMVAAG
jgi:glucose-6-phosphate 1-epimerase